jgi:hypothetical protein
LPAFARLARKRGHSATFPVNKVMFWAETPRAGDNSPALLPGRPSRFVSFQRISFRFIEKEQSRRSACAE